MSNVAVIDPNARPNLVAGGRPLAIVPQTMDEAYRMAKAVCMAGMAPKGMDTPEKAMIAIMRGMEVGLTPFQALDKIAVVNGRPTIWGDGAMALVRGSGACEAINETIQGDGDAMTAVCSAKRKGERDPIVGTFSVADAKKAGLWSKQGPWAQFPKRMLQMRARAFALRDGFADVLGGLYLREEIEDDGREQREARRPPAPPTPSAPLTAIEHQPEQPAQEPSAQGVGHGSAEGATDAAPGGIGAASASRKPPMPPSAKKAIDFDAVLQRYGDMIAKARDGDDLDNAYMSVIDPVRDEAPAGFVEQANAMDDARRGELEI